jgi:dTDP-4-dehydrorhamnose 3,5-epimerase
MKITPTELSGVALIELEPIEDQRGLFARSFCVDAFAEADIMFSVKQSNISFNNFAGTIRGMHYQRHPFEESKIVRCTRGAIFDVAVDLRPESETFCRWYGAELNAENRLALLVPPGCAHGFQTLTDSTEVLYLMSERYVADSSAGVRHDDPSFGIAWPEEVSSISDKDRNWPDFKGTNNRRQTEE